MIQKEKWKLSGADISYLNMTSAYTGFRYLGCAWLAKDNVDQPLQLVSMQKILPVTTVIATKTLLVTFTKVPIQ